MLSRIAAALYEMARDVERAQNVIRVLEVNYKMHLERSAVDPLDYWSPIAEAFRLEGTPADEAAVYGELVFSTENPNSVFHCVSEAREHARGLREVISEEIWAHLNRTYFQLERLSFDDVVALGRSEFNRRVELFCDAFQGLAHDTMLHGAAWQFLRIGRFMERALMLFQVFEVKRKTLSQCPNEEGRPVDFHQWQALLRSISGYEPYRRCYDARIVPVRVLEFALQNPIFPRSLLFSLRELGSALREVCSGSPAQQALLDELRGLDEEVTHLHCETLIVAGGHIQELRTLRLRCEGLAASLEEALFHLRQVARVGGSAMHWSPL